MSSKMATMPCCGGEGPKALPPGAKVLSNEVDPQQLMCLLIETKDEPGSMKSHNLHAVVIKGVLDEQHLRDAVDALQARHPLMRAKLYGSIETGFCLLETSQKIPIYIHEGSYDCLSQDLERALEIPFDPFKGPCCYVTYIKHPGGTGVLMWGNCHLSDGRGCEIMLSHLLKLYDGQDVPFFHNVHDLSGLKKQSERFKRLGTFVPEDTLRTWRSIQAEYKSLQTKGERRDGVINETFTAPPSPDYKPFHEGVCIEIARLAPDEQNNLRSACRMAGTTVTGAIVAAFKHAAILELVARGRGAEQIAVGLDMNQRGRGPIGSKYSEEMGNFVYDIHLHLPVELDFWETARQMKGFVDAVLTENVGFEAGLVNMPGMNSVDAVILMSQMQPAALLGAISAMMEEVGNISSLGVLDKFGKYDKFEVLENHTVAHIGPIGCKLNVCTSGSSGVMSICVIASNNLVERPRDLANVIARSVQATLRNPPAVDDKTKASRPEAVELTRAAELMQPLIAKNRERVSTLKHAGALGSDGAVFLGDCSGAYNATTTAQVVVAAVLSIFAAGPLMSMPVLLPSIQEQGVFNYMCEDGEAQCDAQQDLIATAYSVNLSLTLVLALFAGYAFDLVGARKVSAFGSLMVSVGMAMVAIGMSLNARAWPVTQTICVFGMLAIADCGGLLSSMGLLGWMWHYPKVQALIIGLAQATGQASGILGFTIKWLVSSGYTVSDGFFIVAVLSLFSAFGLWKMVPTQVEYFKEAARVMNVVAAALDNSSQVSCRHFRHQVYEVVRTMRLFKMQNGMFLAAGIMGLASCILWNSSFATEYEVMFGSHKADRLVNFYGAANGLVGVVLNPITGFLIEKLGYKTAYMLFSVCAWIMAISSWLWSFNGQMIFTTSAVLWLGTYSTILAKWPVLFAPPHIYGTFQGIIAASMSVGSLPLVMVAGILTPENKEVIALPVAIFSTVAGAMSALVLLVMFSKSYGIPPKPPKNRYG